MAFGPGPQVSTVAVKLIPGWSAPDTERQSSGKVTAQVEEKRPAAAAPDKLTLSKGSSQGKSAAEYMSEVLCRPL